MGKPASGIKTLTHQVKDRLIQQALETLMQGRTTFVIAQRLGSFDSSVDCDWYISSSPNSSERSCLPHDSSVLQPTDVVFAT